MKGNSEGDGNMKELLPMMTSEELLAFTRISRSTMVRMIEDGRLPTPLKTGPKRPSRLLFDRAAVVAAVKKWRLP